jgi:hypothetical protein
MTVVYNIVETEKQHCNDTEGHGEFVSSYIYIYIYLCFSISIDYMALTGRMTVKCESGMKRMFPFYGIIPTFT